MRYKWIGIIVLMYLCTLIDGIASDLGLMENLPGYAVISSIEQLNRSRCRTEMEQFRDAVDRRILWSLKMLDTSGQPSSGYILGNNFWMGNRVQCESLSQKLPFVYSPQNAKNNSRFRNPADEYPPFELNFFGAYIHERGTIQYRHTSMSREDVIILGLCLPASCTENEVTTMVTKVIDDRLLLADRLYSMDLKLLRVSDLRPDYALFFNAKIIIIILILTALFSTVTAGTLYDMLVVQKKLKEYKEYSSDQSKVSVHVLDLVYQQRYATVYVGYFSIDAVNLLLLCNAELKRNYHHYSVGVPCLRYIRYRIPCYKVVAVCWCLSVLCNCSILFGVPSVNKALVSSIIYEAFFKIGWSLGIGWLIVACATNNGVISSIEQLNRSRCRTEMEQFRDAIDRRILWSLKMLDTSGQPSSGYILGNNFWLGNRPQCESLSQKLPFVYSPQNAKNNSRFRNPADEYPPFELNFFGAYIHQGGTIQYHTSTFPEDVIILGLCLPASCTEDEVTTMVTKVIDDKLLLADRLYSMDLKLLRVSDLRPDYALFFNAKIIIIILILTALLGTVTAGTLYDMLVVQKKLREYKEYSSDQSKVSELQDTGEIELNNIVEKKAPHEEIAVIQKPKTVSRSKGILTYFSIYSNLKEIFNVNNTSEDLKMIHGLKVFGTVTIIVGHAMAYKSNIADRGQLFIIMSTLWYQIIANATLVVETYFFLSGFILTFGYIKLQRKPRSFRECAIGFIGGIIKRYVRLTSAQVVTILIVIVTFTYLANTSLFFMNEPAHELCSKYWWANVLYINNFFEWQDLCMSWTWYISNDMQFFMLGIFLLMLSTSYYYASLSLSVTMIIAASAYRAYVTYVTEYLATNDAKFETLSFMYIRPWMRIQPYLLGMGTALILHKLNYKLHLSKKVVAVCWCLSVLCICSIIFGVPSVKKSLVSSIIYEAFFKIGWSLGIGWLIVACVTNNGGIINRFLSLPCWVPFSRVSLFVYLIDPVVVFYMDMCSHYAYNGEILNLITVGLGQFVIVYILAFILSAVCEVPAILLFRAHKFAKVQQ
ncbi:nose resistant to fluoxetine protein 6-like isoform X4 [Megachile rotundata]|uniref:nose resistant to fluoxetine protein 6-like isoform X4 n=1 Tax=Megachile rotundata TaxID=143995 RepID=UPI003FD0EC69